MTVSVVTLCNALARHLFRTADQVRAVIANIEQDAIFTRDRIARIKAKAAAEPDAVRAGCILECVDLHEGRLAALECHLKLIRIECADLLAGDA